MPSGGDSASFQRGIQEFINTLPDKQVTEAEQLQEFLTKYMNMSRFYCEILYRRIHEANNLEDGAPVQEEHLKRWASGAFDTNRPIVSFFHLMKSPLDDWIGKDAVRDLIVYIIDNLPQFSFLVNTPDFQTRFADTILSRIYFHFDRSQCGRIYFRAIRNLDQSPDYDVISEIAQIENENPDKRVSSFFSYEHFYVIYCSFWEYDKDRDFLLDQQDLLSYDNHGLSSRTVERIFGQYARKFVGTVPSRMGYEDFTFFLICQHDKSSEMSIKYWFKIMDLDMDGIIRLWEMKYFYDEQIDRIVNLGYESVKFEDIVCQMHDWIKPKNEGEFTLSDFLKDPKSAGTFFALFFSLNGFFDFEVKDSSVLLSAKKDDIPEWNIFCQQEYRRLAASDVDDED